MSKKAVLIFDMPEACCDCPCCYDGMECTGTPDFKSLIGFDRVETRPDWCPLIEVTNDYIRRAEMYLDRVKYAKEDRL
jgi:hypothetical protein